MKKVFKIIGWAFLTLIIVGNIGRLLGRSAYENLIATQVQRANQDCPIPLGHGIGQVSKIQVEDRNVTYYLDYSSKYYNLLTKTRTHGEVKEILMMALLCMNGQGGNHGDVLIDKLISQDYGMKYVISSGGSRQFECVASVQDLRQMRSSFTANPHEALHRLLELQMEIENTNLPVSIEEGMDMTDYALDDDNIVVTIAVDENLYSINEFRNNLELIKQSMLEAAIDDPESKSLLDLCKISHTGLAYHVVGKHSGRSVDIVISSDEIRRYVDTPASLNIQ